MTSFNIKLSNLFFVISFLSLYSCANNKTDSPVQSDNSAETSTAPICTESFTYSPGVTVSATAQFKKRGLLITSSSGQVTGAVLGAVASQSLPIKYAEVRIYQNGTLVQCGRTNATGQLMSLDESTQIKIPNDSGAYTIEVLARSNKSFSNSTKPTVPQINATVMQDIYNNTVYKISSEFTSTGQSASNSELTLTAEADEAVSVTLEGGAFNIYNNWITTFEYLINTNNTSQLDVSCLNTPLKMYWKAGFNPAQYIYPDANPSNVPNISFYLRDYEELYINGGKLDNVSSADTDHFDDTVIFHEIGHHIEAVCSKMDSPGGAHYGQYRIDPRLAWSEGWGNFLGAHLMKNNLSSVNPTVAASLPNNEWLFYLDTSGYYANSNISGSFLILMRLNKLGTDNSGNSSTRFDVVDPTNFPGESHTREVSIARGLFKAVNTCATNCVGDLDFDKFWKALGTTSDGIGYAQSSFSSSVKFLNKVYQANSNTFSNNLLSMLTTDEALHPIANSAFTTTAPSSSTGTISVNTWPGYAPQLTTNSSCNKMALEPKNTSKTISNESDQRYSNHFYFIKKSDLASVTQIQLVPDSSCNVDLDLVVFKEGYSYNEDCTAYNSNGSACTTFAKTTSNDVAVYSRTNGGSESISLSSLNENFYLLNVRGFTSNPNNVNGTAKCIYKLTDQNGSTLCPSTSY